LGFEDWEATALALAPHSVCAVLRSGELLPTVRRRRWVHHWRVSWLKLAVVVARAVLLVAGVLLLVAVLLVAVLLVAVLPPPLSLPQRVVQRGEP
jgi:hypothetical protein